MGRKFSPGLNHIRGNILKKNKVKVCFRLRLMPAFAWASIPFSRSRQVGLSAGSEFAVEHEVKNHYDHNRNRDIGYKHAKTRQAFTQFLHLALCAYFCFHNVPKKRMVSLTLTQTPCIPVFNSLSDCINQCIQFLEI